MRKSSLIAFLFIGAVVFYVTGGGLLFGLGGGYSSQPDRESERTVTTTVDARQNPFVGSDSLND